MKVMKWNIVLLMFAGFVLSTGHATVIDSYQTPQTADRDDPQFRPASETITGNRLFAIDGSAVNASIGSGELRCDLGNDESSCSTLYNAEQFVDLTENNQNMGIKIFVSAISGPGEVSIQFTDTTNLSSGTLTALSLGENLIEFSDLFPINGQPDYSRIKGILIGFSTEAAQTSISIELIETANGSGPSGQGFSLNNQNSATFFDPARDGEGIQFIVLPDNETIVMTWYTYLNGDQVWLIGAGEMNTNPTTFDLTITDGATFGEDFDPTTVNRTLWGTASITLPDCNTLSLNATPVLAEFESVNLQMQRLLTADCGTLNQSPTNQQNAVNFENSGTYFDPTRDGEGLQIALEADQHTLVATWYTYLNGEQVWLIGAGSFDENQSTMEVTLTEGADFGADFDPNDVIRTNWGNWQIRFIDCNSVELTANPSLPAYEPITIVMSKGLTGTCS